jgi:hypothetical protein
LARRRLGLDLLKRRAARGKVRRLHERCHLLPRDSQLLALPRVDLGHQRVAVLLRLGQRRERQQGGCAEKQRS